MVSVCELQVNVFLYLYMIIFKNLDNGVLLNATRLESAVIYFKNIVLFVIIQYLLY